MYVFRHITIHFSHISTNKEEFESRKDLDVAVDVSLNKCVSRTDTNPPFAFDIAFFGQGKVSRGFYRGYRDG